MIQTSRLGQPLGRLRSLSLAWFCATIGCASESAKEDICSSGASTKRVTEALNGGVPTPNYVGLDGLELDAVVQVAALDAIDEEILTCTGTLVAP